MTKGFELYEHQKEQIRFLQIMAQWAEAGHVMRMKYARINVMWFCSKCGFAAGFDTMPKKCKPRKPSVE